MRIRASADWLNCLNKIDKKDSKIDFEMSVIVVEAIRERCASFMILTATVSEIEGGQKNVSILVVLITLIAFRSCLISSSNVRCGPHLGRLTFIRYSVSVSLAAVSEASSLCNGQC